MKRLLTLTIALVIASVAFGQDDYKHPLKKKKAKDTSEKFKTETVSEAKDYKHPKTLKTSKRVYIRQGNGANAAAATKHPFGD
jgi:hypothetical protein